MTDTASQEEDMDDMAEYAVAHADELAALDRAAFAKAANVKAADKYEHTEAA